MQYLSTSYQLPLVLLSFLIATIGSYVALDVAGRIRSGDSGARWIWVFAAALALGGAIWSMHFVSMLALQLPVPVRYDMPWLFLSALIAVAAAASALGLVAGPNRARPSRLVPGALLMGIAVAGMHYMGMGAMRGPFRIIYDKTFVTLSVLIAVVASYVALWLLATAPQGLEARALAGRRWLAALTMGTAVSGMHYTGMYAAGFCSIPATSLLDAGLLPNSVLGTMIGLITFICLGVGVAAASADRRLQALETDPFA